MKNRQEYTQPLDRDYYFYDALYGEGLDLNDPRDWVSIGILSEITGLSDPVDRRLKSVV